MIRRAVLTADRWLTGASLALACALLAIVSGLGMWQVLARFIFEEPSTWTEEAMRRLLIWMVMFGVVVAFRRGALVSVDLMLARSRGAWRRVVQAIVTLVTLAFLGALLWFGIALTIAVRFQTFASLDFLSISWAYAALPVGAALAIVAVIANHLDPLHQELETAQ